MIHRRHYTITGAQLASDVVMTNLALLAAWYLRFTLEVVPLTKGMQELGVYARMLPLVAVIFPVAFSLQGLYRNRSTRLEEWTGVAIGTLLGAVVLSGVLLWVRPGNPGEFYSRATLAIFAVAEFVFVIAGRAVIRVAARRQVRKGIDVERVLIAGNGDLARAVADRLVAHGDLGFRLEGYLSHDENGEPMDGIERLGSIDQAEAIVRARGISKVFVAIPQQSSSAMMSLLDRLIRESVSIHVVPDLLQFMAIRSRVEDLDGLPMINLSDTPLEGWSRIAKRGFDFVAAAAMLVLLSPLIGLIALLVWLEDRGPVFYRQVRMGLDGSPFMIIKFRSMAINAESATGAVWANRDDPRRTRIGAFLRSWSLDELPQLWNVLRGDMSLVGPRPERPEFVEQFRAEFPHYMLRHKVQSGITGWAQVHGWRGNTSIRMRIEHDLYYIENWSLLLDLKILLMTLRHGFRSENAY